MSYFCFLQLSQITPRDGIVTGASPANLQLLNTVAAKQTNVEPQPECPAAVLDNEETDEGEDEPMDSPSGRRRSQRNKQTGTFPSNRLVCEVQ